MSLHLTTQKSGRYAVQSDPKLIALVIAERRRLGIGEGFTVMPKGRAQ